MTTWLLTSNNKEVLDDLSPSKLDELAGGRGGATSSDEVVDNKNGLALFDRILLELKGVLSVLKRVGDLVALSGELLGLARV